DRGGAVGPGQGAAGQTPGPAWGNSVEQCPGGGAGAACVGGVVYGGVIAFHSPGGDPARGGAGGGDGRGLGPGCRTHGRSGTSDVPGKAKNGDLCPRPDRPRRARRCGAGSRQRPAAGGRSGGATKNGRRAAG